MSIALPTEIEHVRTDELLPFARNSRTHSDAQIGQLVASIREFGFTNPVLVREDLTIVAGHGRVMAAKQVGLAVVPVIRVSHLSDAQARAYVIADNKLALNAGWDDSVLSLELGELGELGFDLSLIGFSEEELAGLDLIEDEDASRDSDAEHVPNVQAELVTRLGDVWMLGPHRVMCGDSTSLADVEKLMGGKRASLLHADPPYGMGKVADGVANDNIYNDDLDRFQMTWWATFRAFLEDNASAYIWGNAPDLWRLWWRGGLCSSERLELRNQIVWDKKNIAGMKSPGLTQYPVTTEHALFFQLGDQFRGNVNADDFPESWEPIRAYMAGEAKAAGMKSADVKRICGCGMYSHWFTRSQFTLIPEAHYKSLQAAFPGHFLRKWREIKAEWDRVKGGPTSEIQGARSYFDNAHDVMRDVWEFPRVNGEERHGHATPKPVAMMERVMKSSLRRGEICVEPFGGSGSTLIGAHRSGRLCFTMELQPVYVDVIVRRWQEFTGAKATLESDGRTFDVIAAQRRVMG